MPLKLVKRTGSSAYWITGTVRGSRIRESTGTDDPKLAEEARAAREAESFRGAIHEPVIGVAKHRWPMLMDEATVSEYLTQNCHDLGVLIAAALVPPPREHVSGEWRWNRTELDRAMERLWGLEEQQRHEQSKADTRRLIAAYDPTAPRPGRTVSPTSSRKAGRVAK
jgi:hypothetical protein